MKSGFYIYDSRKLDKKLEKDSVDVIMTSPPYWDLKDYGTENQIGLDQKYDDYKKDVIRVLDKCYNITKKTGSMWIVVDTLKKNREMITLPFDIVSELKEYQKNTRGKNERWFLQDIIIWQKDKTLPWSHKGKVRSIFEYILFFSKDKQQYKYYIDKIRDPVNLKKWWKSHPERYNPRGKVPTEIWKFDLITQGWGEDWVKHACPFPIELVEKILLLTTKKGDVVFDPFAGSGMVLAVGDVMQRKYIGFDLNKDYRDMFYETLLPRVREKMEERKEEGLSLKKTQDELERKIIGLRKLKYAKELLRALFAEIPELKKVVRFVYVDTLDKKEMKCKIYYVFDNKLIKKDKILKKIEKLQEKKKFRRYSLQVSVNMISIQQIPSNMEGNEFYIYKGGKFQKFSAHMKGIDEYSHTMNQGFDIISNQNLSVE